MTETIETYGPEWLAAEAIARAAATGVDATDELARCLIDPGWNWGCFLGHLVTHKLRGPAAELLLNERFRPLLSDRFRDFFRELVNLNRRRMQVFAAEAARISNAATEGGVTVALRKGIVLDYQCYGGRGTRLFSDLDFMVPTAHQAGFVGLLEQLGYTAGEYDSIRDEVVPYERRAVVIYRFNPDHLPRMALATADPVLPFVQVDLAGSFTWTNGEYQIPLEPAFREGVWLSIAGYGSVPVFSPQYQMLDVILHLFREGFVENAVMSGLALTLSGFVDVASLWRHTGDALVRGGWTQFVTTQGVASPVAWVLGHTDRLFGTKTLAEAGLEALFAPEWAAAWRSAGGAAQRWHGDVRRRLFEGGRLYRPNSYGMDAMVSLSTTT
ncbi:MAG: nucleotidyltransferase family protein [Gemmatimonadota bacterium]|nr:nucleotidyltransferase family protein [Gemmatimonadota bacterium]